MTDALRIYHHWIDVEKDYNDTKSIMMIAYIVGILISAGVTLWMFDRFSKK
jgi:H+/gluconate symporter-like permease